MPNRSRHAVAFIAATVLFAACSSGPTTPPAGSAAQVIARHVDTLLTQAMALANDNTAYNERVSVLQFVEAAAYLGAVPSNVALTTAQGSATWRAVELESVSANGSDSTYILVAYADTDLHNTIFAVFDDHGAVLTEDVTLSANDTIEVLPTDDSGNTAPISASGTCTLATGLVNPPIGEDVNGTCTPATFTTTMSMTFPTHDGVSTALTSIAFTGATIAGARVQQTPGLARLIARLRAAHAARVVRKS